MSIDSARVHPVRTQGRRCVPWMTVVPFAVVLAYADGFWMLSMRGAVGAIERSQEPFTAWLRESTLLLPAFVFAVLGALTLAMRMFGSQLRTTRSVPATALLIAAAGTIVGIAAIVVSSVYDYRLESDQLLLMGSMHGTCDATCTDLAQQASVATFIRAGLYVTVLMLASNLILIGWLVAMRGGRLNVATVRPRTHRAAGTGSDGALATIDRAGDRLEYQVEPGNGDGSRVDDVRLLLVVGLLCGAHIHVATVPEHLTKWGAAGLLPLLLAAAEVAVAASLLKHVRPALLIIAVVVSLIPFTLWLYSRTAGLPFGPSNGPAEAFGLPGAVSAALEVTTLLAALMLLGRGGNLLRRPAASPHVRALVLVAVIAVAAIALAGTATTWFDQPGSAGTLSVSHSHPDN